MRARIHPARVTRRAHRERAALPGLPEARRAARWWSWAAAAWRRPRCPRLLATGAQVTVVAPEVAPGDRGRAASRWCGAPSRPPTSTAPGSWWPPRRPRSTARSRRPPRSAGVFVNAVDDPDDVQRLRGRRAARAAASRRRLHRRARRPPWPACCARRLEAVLPEDLERWVGAARALRERQRRARACPWASGGPLLLAGARTSSTRREAAARERVRLAGRRRPRAIPSC